MYPGNTPVVIGPAGVSTDNEIWIPVAIGTAVVAVIVAAVLVYVKTVRGARRKPQRKFETEEDVFASDEPDSTEFDVANVKDVRSDSDTVFPVQE